MDHLGAETEQTNLPRDTPHPEDVRVQQKHGNVSSTLVLIESRSLIRDCLIRWLEQHGLQVDSAVSAQECGTPCRPFDQVDLIILSIGPARVTSPEVLAGIDRLTQDLSDIPLVLLADRDEIEDVGEAIRHGARGYIPTNLDLTEAVEALRFVLAGGTYVPADALVRAMQRPAAAARRPPQSGPCALDSLTPREMEVVGRLRQGMPNKVIAHELNISESTVKVFVRRILTKLHAINRTEVAYLTQSHFEDMSGAHAAPSAGGD